MSFILLVMFLMFVILYRMATNTTDGSRIDLKSIFSLIVLMVIVFLHSIGK